MVLKQDSYAFSLVLIFSSQNSLSCWQHDSDLQNLSSRALLFTPCAHAHTIYILFPSSIPFLSLSPSKDTVQISQSLVSFKFPLASMPGFPTQEEYSKLDYVCHGAIAIAKVAKPELPK